MENNNVKLELIENIKEMKNGSFEQMVLITFYSLSSYFKALYSFGSNSDITRDNLNVIKEMFKILKKERTLLNYILKHLDEFDLEATEKVIGMLDKANDETVIFYYDVISDIEDASLTHQEYRAIRRKPTIPSLIESDSYASEVVALGENYNSLKEFLCFEDEFWKYIETEVREVNTTIDIEEKIVYASPLLDQDGNVARVLLLVPKIVDLKTALLAIKLYTKAHDIYLCIGKKYQACSDTLEQQNQKKYEEEYILSKAQSLLNKKM